MVLRRSEMPLSFPEDEAAMAKVEAEIDARLLREARNLKLNVPVRIPEHVIDELGPTRHLLISRYEQEGWKVASFAFGGVLLHPPFKAPTP
jgi:hypothetical protein